MVPLPVGENEIRHPDLSTQCRGAVEWRAGLIGQREIRDNRISLKISMRSGAAGAAARMLQTSPVQKQEAIQ